MSFLQAIQNFFDSIFNRGSPEVQKKLQMRKLENELKAYQPAIFKNGNLLPNFAESIRVLYLNTKPINDILATTIADQDIQRSRRYEAQLVFTGFTSEGQKIIESLEYSARKSELTSTTLTISQIFDRQHKKLDKILHELGSETFKKIDADLVALHQLNDFCKFNFVTILQIFDPHYISADLKYVPSYQEVPIGKLTNILEDLYYVMKGLKISNSTVNAITALSNLKASNASYKLDIDGLVANLKKIAYVINHLISPEKLKMLILYAKADISYNPKTISYSESARKNFSEMLSNKFKSDEQRIKTEMKDDKITSELARLFGSTPLLTLNGYNDATNQKILEGSGLSFIWLLPMRILKTFLAIYLTDSIRSLLNDIVIEGFFNNPSYKTDFSSDVFAALETAQVLQNFEDMFNSGKEFSVSTLDGYLRDSHNDPDFFKKLEQLVKTINLEASKLITKETNNINKLSKHLNDLLADSKKPTSEIISNLKVLMMSSRNRDNTDLLEQQHPKWDIFFEIMKNYAIISS